MRRKEAGRWGAAVRAPPAARPAPGHQLRNLAGGGPAPPPPGPAPSFRALPGSGAPGPARHRPPAAPLCPPGPGGRRGPGGGEQVAGSRPPPGPAAPGRGLPAVPPRPPARERSARPGPLLPVPPGGPEGVGRAAASGRQRVGLLACCGDGWASESAPKDNHKYPSVGTLKSGKIRLRGLGAVCKTSNNIAPYS